MAPELVKDTKSCFASDLWAFGCTLYQMICGGRALFSRPSEYLTYKAITNGSWHTEVLDSRMMSQDQDCKKAKDLISQLLQQSPQDRIGNRTDGYDELRSNPFFYYLNFDEIREGIFFPPPLKL
eukprot:TRINITY_DN9718_c0_g1_i2.p2 TRINITY_DN9718_c0_g1~~TRINITY_DN9718_c0_g1_i2.p2  ORF type:complete len:124 (+),score=24.78 TRINITY_DN9718_c0_g1_i2:1209-1580(+)